MLKQLLMRAMGSERYLRYVIFPDRLYHSCRPFRTTGRDIIRRHLIRRGDVVLDVGANIGRFAGFAAGIVGRFGKVYCFEPVSMSSRVLKAMKRLRRLEQVVVVDSALSEEAGSSEIVIPLKDGWLPLLPVAHMGKDAGQDVIRETIHTQRLDEFARDIGLDRVDFIKCDTEGHEYQVFAGGVETLKRHRPSIFCEVNEGYMARHGLEASALFDLLGVLGYRSFLPTDQGRLLETDGYQGASDYVFVHPSRMDAGLTAIIANSDD